MRCVCAADPVNLAVGQPVGGVGLMMHNRRRNRVNSTVVRREGSRVTLRVDQSFGNCPKYIQVRVQGDQTGAWGHDYWPHLCDNCTAGAACSRRCSAMAAKTCMLRMHLPSTTAWGREQALPSDDPWQAPGSLAPVPSFV